MNSQTKRRRIAAQVPDKDTKAGLSASGSSYRFYTLLFHNQYPPLKFFVCISYNIKHGESIAAGAPDWTG
ncbi:MAG: hypothetical protein WCV67_18790 [Victivallaceae bacterium]